jgi:tetratricopeptide (TPR) repeat protein
MKKKSASITALIFCFSLLSSFLFIRENVFAQGARISEEQKLLKTYPFHDPNPVPILISNNKIYPYFTIEGFTGESKEMPWKVVTLENDYIQVFVLPEVGGKVWGAIEKSTGFEFVYRNEVMKFRDIAMRGPWTSGGIEFNFGIIGHSPSTASPVDYLVTENDDGSVSCWIGNMDLTSRTHWRIEIRVPKDKAYFETHTQWYNPTPMSQSYYNWMTGAAVARNDLEFFCPGYLYLEHSGEAKSWPVDEEGRKISLYAENNFGGSKSYHVVGTYEDFFGGYYHDMDVGFGQWGPYEEIPGQKLWLWALSRSGGIWEDLLTDTDSQYIEFQAGRLLNQYSAGQHQNPIREAGFPAGATDRWEEVWFPYKNIKGMVDASPAGVMNIQREGNNLFIGVNALETLNDSLLVFQDGEKIHSVMVGLEPMEIYTLNIQSSSDMELEVKLGNNKLYYSTREDSLKIKRPFTTDPEIKLSDIEQLYQKALDAVNFRNYTLAETLSLQVLEKDPAHLDALLLLADLNIRKGDYSASIDKSMSVLRHNTYDARANYLAGLAYRATGDLVNALECLGWAARSMEFRSIAYDQMAEIYLRLGKYDQAEKYARKSLDFNTWQMMAWQVLAIANRKSGDLEGAADIVGKMLEMDPLNHFARFEKMLLKDQPDKKPAFLDGINNEFPEETCLEIALFYQSLNLMDEAIQVLSQGPDAVKNNLWTAYLLRKSQPEKSNELLGQSLNKSPEFVFPYRPESLNMLKWANGRTESWKTKYYLALNLAAVGRKEEAMEYLNECGNAPDFWVFYMTRADLSDETDKEKQLQDIKKAWELEPDNWRTWNRMVRYYEINHQYDLAVDIAEKAHKKYPENYNVGFQYAKALLNTGEYKKSINVLTDIQILPFEGSYESRLVYEQAHLKQALEYVEDKKHKKAIETLNQAMEWPENIGVGKPYEPDERMQEFLLAYNYQKIGEKDLYEKYMQKVIENTEKRIDSSRPENLLGLVALQLTGKSERADALYQKIVSNTDLSEQYRQWLTNQYNAGENQSTPVDVPDADFSEYTLTAQIGSVFKN